VLGALVGLALYLSPFTVGGGDVLTQQLLTGGSGMVVPAALGYFLIRFVTGPLSYAAGTPGGLFAPLLALGALWGVLGHAAVAGLPGVGASPIPFALVGMAAFFAATVRAPFTGIVLVVEMTAIATGTVRMLAACFAATLTATLLRNPPVYDSLRDRMLGRHD
jgi:CIC family chloride channel protein